MAGDLIRFVDSLVASPTTRLDLNDETSWWVKSFSAPPPRLRRSVANNAMRDGVNVGSSSYDARTLTIEVECRKSTQDLAATEIQKLWRELDRADNFLMYQPTGAAKPVFFRTYRSDTSQLADVMGQQAMRSFTIEVLAEPFALGLKETLGPYTINNDPAAGSNGCYATLGTVLGDVPAPAAIRLADGALANNLGDITLAWRTDALAGNIYFAQAESLTTGTDTTNPGGGPDATMSGTGTNNYLTTSFATTATMATRLIGAATIRRAPHRVLACVQRSDSTSVMQARFYDDSSSGAPGDTVTIPLSTSRQLVDLGLFDFREGWGYSDEFGYQASGTDPGTSAPSIAVEAARTSGTGTLKWDFLLFVPADVAMMVADIVDVQAIADGIVDRVAEFGAAAGALKPRPMAGAIPRVVPTKTNRVTFIRDAAKARTTTVNVDYWPAYLFVRPSAS